MSSTDETSPPPLSETMTARILEAGRSAIMADAPLELCVRDRWHRYLLASREYAQRRLIDENELIGRTLDDVYRDGAAEPIKQRDRAAIKSGLPSQFDEIAARNPITGEMRSEWTTRIPIKLEDKVEALAILTIDVTRLQQSNDALEAREQQWRLLTEDAVQGIFIHNFRVPLFVNKRFAEMFGYDNPDEFVSIGDWRAIFTPEEMERTEQYRQKLLERSEPSVQRRFHGKKKDGSLIWCDAVLRYPVPWEDETCVQATFVDVTKQVEAQMLVALLTGREHDVVTRLYRGLGNKEVALELGISHRTVEIYRARAIVKLQVSNTAELVAKVGLAIDG